MPTARPALLDDAALWVVRTHDPAFRDWDGFTLWLEAEAAHNDAYEAALDAHDAAGLMAIPLPVPADVAAPAEPAKVVPIRRWRAAWISTAVAAALVALVAVPSLLPRHDRYTIGTAPGEQRTVTLPDGSVIAMNGSTRLELDRRAARTVRLEAGEASFTVVHDAQHPFMVSAGATQIADVGTSFNVLRTADATDVAVAEGAIVYDPDGAAVKLTAGRTLHDPDRGMTEIGTADPAEIAAWKTGRLVYRDASIGRVARDLARMIGEPVAVAPEVSTRNFSGTIIVRGVERRQLFARIGALTGLGVAHDGAGWQLGEGEGAR